MRSEETMSIPCKFERSILSYDEHEVILRSHHPEIYDAGLDDLKALRQRLRDMREKERTLARAKRREARGKGAPRGESFPGTSEHPLQRKQVFAAALKRVNREIDRMQKLHARNAHMEAAAPCSRHAPCGAVSSSTSSWRHGERRHAPATEQAAAYTGSSRQDRQRLAGNEKCAGGTRRPQQIRPVNFKEKARCSSSRKASLSAIFSPTPSPSSCSS